MPVHCTACKLMELHARSCNCMLDGWINLFKCQSFKKKSACSRPSNIKKGEKGPFCKKVLQL